MSQKTLYSALVLDNSETVSFT